MAKKKTIRIVLAVIGVALAVLCWWLSPIIRALFEVGLPTKTQQRVYEATSIENLQAIRTALLLYHDNEGQFPAADGWMEGIRPMLKTHDLSFDEAAKKLINPAISDLQPGEHGYAMNAEASDAFRGDLKETTILIYESPADRKRNASGDPQNSKGNHGITLDGNVVTIE